MDQLEDFLQNVDQEIRRARESTLLNQRRPVNRPKRNRQRAIEETEFKVMQRRMDSFRLGSGIASVIKTIVTGQCHSSTTPLNELKPITLSEMQIPMLHKGRYLACRSVSEPYVVVATATLIEDLNGEIEDLSLYNFRVNIGDGKWLPQGTLMFIKEPYLKYASMGENTLIRVDSPSDVVFVDETNQKMLQWANALRWYKPQKLNVDQLRLKGNDLYKRKDYEGSLKYYKQALMIEPNSAILNLNKAAALLLLEHYYEAYEAAQMALENGADKQKSLLRLGRAAYGMRDWERASGYFQQVLQEYPTNKEAQIDLKNSNVRLQEARNGQYDLMRLYDLAYNKKERNIDVADYTGPVSIVDIPGKGRGLVATENIPKGTLLLVSKAFSIAYEDELPNVFVFSINMLNDQAQRKTEALNMIKIIQNLRSNPQKADELYSLFAGNSPKNVEIPRGVIDVSRIENIATFNSFEPEDCIRNEVKEVEKYDICNLFSPTGLWILPSFINHSCIGNSFRTFYGDVMTVFALTDLKKNEEITFGYVDALKPLKTRVECFRHYQFICECRLCQLDRSDPQYEHRVQLVEMCRTFKKLISTNPQECLRKLEPLLKQIRDSYGDRNELKTQMHHPLILIAMAYRSIGQHEKGLKFLKEAAQCLTLNLKYEIGVPLLISQADCNACMDRWREARRNINEAMMLNKIRMGSDEKLFKFIYPEIHKFLQ